MTSSLAVRSAVPKSAMLSKGANHHSTSKSARHVMLVVAAITATVTATAVTVTTKVTAVAAATTSASSEGIDQSVSE